MALRWRRRIRRSFVRLALTIFAALIFLDAYRYHALHILSNQREPLQYTTNRKIFIASTHWNNEFVLRNHWNDQIVQIVNHFGPQNVYVSVYESGSWDDSKGALRELDLRLEALGVSRTIILDPATHLDEIEKSPAAVGWIETPRGMKELRRIPYLSSLRNLSLNPLVHLHQNGTDFDTVLFLNDVVFTVADVLNLLATNNGDYAAACSLDFSKAPAFYDTFALRDSEGHEALMPTWPYFRSRESRAALKTSKPVPVRSCWNGMVAMPPEPFYDSHQPLRFRGIPDSLAGYHLEGSECCLVHQDNPLTRKNGVWLNPNVAVGYNKAAYDAMKGRGPPTTLFSYLRAVWTNRLKRWLTSDGVKRFVIYSRISRWKWGSRDQSRQETGFDCLINEMQVLVHNGWKHL